MFTLVLCMMMLVSCAQAGETSEPPAAVTVEPDRITYAPGDTAQVTVTRETEGQAIFAAACDLFVEARCDSGWTTVFEPDCTNVRVRPTRLARGESVVIPFKMDITSGPCHPHRLRLRYQENDSAGYRVGYSGEFEITDR